MTQFKPFYEDVQAHYDLSDDFFALFLDESMTYSCAYFERQDMTLAEAQQAKIDLSLAKCDLKSGMTLLDIGCGWGATARRAAEKYDVKVIGLTLSRNQHRRATELSQHGPARRRSVEFRLQGWEEFHEPVDRIVSIGAFEHFRAERHAAFFEHCRTLLPAGGRMMLHSIIQPDLRTLREKRVEVGHEQVLFAKFIRKYIFPGGQLVSSEVVQRHAAAAGFTIERIQSLQPHYARTLECWAANLEAARDRAIAIASQETYDLYMHYLTGCSKLFHGGQIDVMQFTLTLP